MVRYHPWTQCARYLAGEFISHITAPGFVSLSSCSILFIHILGTALQCQSSTPQHSTRHWQEPWLLTAPCWSPAQSPGAQTKRSKWLHRNVETMTQKEAKSRKSELRWHWGAWFKLNSCAAKREYQHLLHCSSQSLVPQGPTLESRRQRKLQNNLAQNQSGCKVFYHNKNWSKSTAIFC